MYLSLLILLAGSYHTDANTLNFENAVQPKPSFMEMLRMK